MDNTFDATAVETIELLEARLRRIEYAVGGNQGGVVESEGNTPAAKRLANLEYSLHQLALKSTIIQDLLRLRK